VIGYGDFGFIANEWRHRRGYC